MIIYFYHRELYDPPRYGHMWPYLYLGNWPHFTELTIYISSDQLSMYQYDQHQDFYYEYTLFHK